MESPGSSLSITGSWIEIQNSWVPPPCLLIRNSEGGAWKSVFYQVLQRILMPTQVWELSPKSFSQMLTDLLHLGWSSGISVLKSFPGDSHVQPELWTTAFESWFLRFISHQHCGWRMAFNRVRVYAKILVVFCALHMVFYCQVPPSEVDFLVVMIVQMLLIHWV